MTDTPYLRDGAGSPDWIIRGEGDLAELLPPVVTGTSIPTGRRNVSPGICDFRITFSEPMMDLSWSVVEHGRDSMPHMNGLPRLSEDATELVLPLQLEPERIYAFWLNNGVHSNFRDRSGTPLVPYLVGFHTAS